MVKFLNFIAILFLFTAAFGQNNTDYSLYHDKILIIEECNSRGSFDSSITLYAAIFNKYERVMARDAYNACQIAALKNHKLFPDFFTLCAKSGISSRRLLKNPLIRAVYVTDSTKHANLFLKGYNDYLQRIDTALRSEMIQRADNEQRNKGMENYSRICFDNFNRILELSKEGKFPGESLIGNSDEIESMIFPTLCHYPYSYVTMEPSLYEALRSGNLTPISLIYLYGFNQTRKSILYTSKVPIDTLNFNIIYNMPFSLQSNDFTEVNKQRAARKVISMSVQKGLNELNSKYGLDYLIGYY